MTYARVQMFLRERDRARVRSDWGVERSLTADLRRLGVPDDATLVHPRGLPRKATTAVVERPEEDPTEVRRKAGRPRLPRCEHGSIADRCVECAPELGMM